MAETISANLILKSRKRRSRGAITGEADFNTLSRMLHDLGFNVSQSRPSYVTVTAKKELFEHVFDTKLEKKKIDILTGRPDGKTVFYQAIKHANIPVELQQFVDDVAFPVPAVLFRGNVKRT
jgi:hypothetical protein